MTCEKIKDLLPLYAGGDLTQSETDLVNQHLGTCATCRKDLEALTSMLEAVRIIHQKDKPDRLDDNFSQAVLDSLDQTPRPPRTRLYTYFAAAAATLILFLGGSIWFAQYRIDRSMDDVATVIGKIQPITTGSTIVWAQTASTLGKIFDGPYPLDRWQPPETTGVIAIMHRPPAAKDSSEYVIDYCVSLERLRMFRGFPWFEHRKRQLIEQAGDSSNIFVAVCTLGESSAITPSELEQLMTEKLNPRYTFRKGV